MGNKNTEKLDRVRQEDELDLVPEDSGPDDPLDLTGYETMQQTFGTGANRRVVLVGKPISLNELVRLAR